MSTRYKKKLPPNCFIERSKYVRFQQMIKGKRYSKQIGLVADSEHDLHVAYMKYKQAIMGISRRFTLDWISERYLKSDEFKALANTTRINYRRSKNILTFELEINEQDAMLGHLFISEITKPLMRSIMKKQLEDLQAQGKKGQGVVNQRLNYVKTIINWAVNNVHGLGVNNNPLRGIGRIKEPQNERYVTHQEYWAQYKVANPREQAFFEVQYLCACRLIEVIGLTDSCDEGDRLLVKRRKGSKDTYITVSPRLRDALDKAKAIRASIDKARSKRGIKRITRLGEDRHLFVKSNGEPLTRTAITQAMLLIKKKMGAGYWNLHLLKSKGVSDSKDKDIAGLSEQMKRRYNTKIEQHNAVE
jgi:integrase